MSLRVVRTPLARLDILEQYVWYGEQSDTELAERYLDALEAAFNDLSESPELGAVRDYRNPALVGMRKWQARKPFDKNLIFYRVADESIHVVRVLYGNRDIEGLFGRHIKD